MTSNTKPGPLESLTLKDHCEMCGSRGIGTSRELEPAFNPSGQAMTLCRDCRIGSAELLHTKKPYVLVTVSGGIAEVVKGSSEADVDILDFDNLEQTGANDAMLSDHEWAYLKENDPDLYEFFAPSREKAERD